jgi:hypothetical protein
VRYRPRNQVPKLLEGSGRFADISEVIFIVILITIDDPIRENDEMSNPIEGTVTQPGRIDRSAQVLGITRMRTIVSPPTVYVREADPTYDDQTEKGEDPVHGSDDSRDMSRSGIANVARTLLFRLFQDLSNTNSRKFRGPRHGPRGKPRWTMTGAKGKERQTTETRQENLWPLTKSLSVAGGIAQDLPTEQAMHLLAVVHAQRSLRIDFVDFPADDPWAECNANDLIAQQVQSIPLLC